MTRPVSRRNLTKGAAWAAPAIAFGSLASAHAVSGWTVWFTPLGIACKTPGASCEKDTGITKGYVVRVQVCHNIPYPTEITIRDATVSLSGAAATLWQVKAVQGSVNCSGTTVGSVADPQPGQFADVVLYMPAATASADSCCVIDFGIEGEPNSSNVSIAGTAPYSWYVPSQNKSSPTPDPLLSMTAAQTPPCEKCEIVDQPPITSTSTGPAPAPAAKAQVSATSTEPTSTAAPVSTSASAAKTSAASPTSESQSAIATSADAGAAEATTAVG